MTSVPPGKTDWNTGVRLPVGLDPVQNDGQGE
jgi:hypothetical protein